MFDSPDLLKPGRDILKLHNARYRILERVQSPEVNSTPDQTPATTLSTRLGRMRPQLYIARDHSGKKKAIKAADRNSYYLLEDELIALQKLNWNKFLPLIPKIAPFVDHRMGFDDKCQVFFIVYEWMDGWMSISDLLTKNGPMILQPDAYQNMTRFRNSLFTAIRILHAFRIIHGDLKDEHIYVKIIEDTSEICKVSFAQIRIIDFGGCYLNSIDDWKGGSLGFSSPFFWEPKHRHLLSRKELKAIDWYGAYAILFYAFTGECFPAATPAYSLFYSVNNYPSIQSYYHELKCTLYSKWQNYDEEIQFLINEIIEFLCSPDLLQHPKMNRKYKQK